MRHAFIGPEGTLRNGWKALLFLLAIGAVNATTFLVLTKGLGLGKFVRGPVGEVIPALLIAAVTWGALRLEGRSWTSVGFSLDRRWVFELAAGMAGGFLILVLSALLLRGMGGFYWGWGLGLGWKSLALSLWTFLWVAFSEETIMRGYPFQRTVAGLGPWGAQLVFALLFAFGHLGNPGIHSASLPLKLVSSLNIGLAAILLGLALLRTRSLALPIGIHWAWNWTQGPLLGFSVSGTGDPISVFKPHLAAAPDWLTGGAVGLEGSLACTLVCSLAILGLAWLPQREEPDGERAFRSR